MNFTENEIFKSIVQIVMNQWQGGCLEIGIEADRDLNIPAITVNGLTIALVKNCKVCLYTEKKEGSTFFIENEQWGYRTDFTQDELMDRIDEAVKNC